MDHNYHSWHHLALILYIITISDKNRVVRTQEVWGICLTCPPTAQVAIVSSFLLQLVGGRGYKSDARGSEGMTNEETQTRPAPSVELLDGNLANLLKLNDGQDQKLREHS